MAEDRAGPATYWDDARLDALALIGIVLDNPQEGDEARVAKEMEALGVGPRTADERTRTLILALATAGAALAQIASGASRGDIPEEVATEQVLEALRRMTLGAGPGEGAGNG